MKYRITLTLFFLTSVSSHIYAWDSTAAKFYPLSVGNSWSYHRVELGMQGNSCIVPLSEYNFIVGVVSDSIMPNGRKYYKIQGPAIYYERVDSSTMNIYRYSLGGECLIDSLFARINDTFISCRDANQSQHQVIDTNLITLFNLTLRTRYIRGNQSISKYYRLVEKLGIQYERVCNFGGATTTLNGCIINGIQYGQMLGIQPVSNEIPSEFKLFQNYPNPFNPVTKIRFDIPAKLQSEICNLKLYDMLGREIAALVNERLNPGTYEVEWDATNHPSGIYYYTLSAGEYQQTRKAVLMK